MSDLPIDASPALYVPNSILGIEEVSDPLCLQQMRRTAYMDSRTLNTLFSSKLVTVLGQMMKKVQLSVFK